jgi:hypothetical protein
MVSNCLITKNGNNGSYGGGMCCVYSASPKLTKCTFSENVAYNGGGLYSDYSSPNLTNCIFSNNTATFCGGGIDNYQSPSVIFTNCIFNNNHAGSYGGGISNYSSSSPTVVNCTFSKNSADYGGAIYNEASSSPNVTNSILWADQAVIDGNEVYNFGGACNPNLSFCDIQGGWPGDGNNIDDDPCFVAPDVNNFHLSPAGSPCIDEGTNTPIGGLPLTDIDGEDRVKDGDDDANAIVDMGADEFYWSPADFNEDEIVNFIDYAIFANAWNSNDSNSNWNPKCDIAIPANNLIDFNDLAVFCEDWLWQAAWTQPVGSMMMGQGMGDTLTSQEAVWKASYPSVAAEAQIEKLEPIEIKQLIDWLEQLWLDEETQKLIDEDTWLKFIESVKKGM